MTTERFNQLINGPLGHPMPQFMLTRLARALLHVVEATGKAGDDALEQFCLDQQMSDDHVPDEEIDPFSEIL
jgi:hypothetical protein